MRITFLGTGTSQGVPIIGCQCPVCRSEAPENQRLRSSIWVEMSGRHIVIDTSPEFRLQALRCRIPRLDALLFTHAHADHVFGFDDIRRFNQIQHEVIPVYATEPTLHVLLSLFGYAFNQRYDNWAVPRAEERRIDGPFNLFGKRIEPLAVSHGKQTVTGFRLGKVAYITDCSAIGTETMAKLRGLDVLILDALRDRPHDTHFSVGEAVEVIAALKPVRAYLTHLCHEVEHHALSLRLPAGIEPAYDGLSITAADPPDWDDSHPH